MDLRPTHAACSGAVATVVAEMRAVLAEVVGSFGHVLPGRGPVVVEAQIASRATGGGGGVGLLTTAMV